MKYTFVLAICFQILATTTKPKEIKNIAIEYDQDGLPLPESLKKVLFDKHLNEQDQNSIFIEKLLQENNYEALYLVKIHNNPIFYLKIRFDDQVNTTVNEIVSLDQTIKKSDYDGSYPFFIPDNLPISILLENLFSYQDQENNKRFIEIFLIAN